MSPDTTPKSSSRRTAASRSKAPGTSEKNSAVQPSVTETISPSVPPQADIQGVPVDPLHPPEQLGEEGASVIIQPHSQLSPPANRLNQLAPSTSQPNQSLPLQLVPRSTPQATESSIVVQSKDTFKAVPLPRNRPIASNSKPEVKATFPEGYTPLPLPGNRPIASNSLKVEQIKPMSTPKPFNVSPPSQSTDIVPAGESRLTKSSLPGRRPVSPSDIQVIETVNLYGQRPIVASDIEVLDTNSLPGHRPIVASHLQISNNHSLPGHRPIASNEIDDSTTLMGYLD